MGELVITRKQTTYNEYVREWIKALQKKFGYTYHTARVKAYALTRILYRLQAGEDILIHVGADRRKGKQKMLFTATLNGYEWLHNPKAINDTIRLVNKETGKIVRITINRIIEDQYIRIRLLQKRRLAAAARCRSQLTVDS